ncbi:MAG: hypothetical protein LAN59_14955 [Acidobacteriia bacterium]|nr:hypothetical protein [Terriglobia bacterium]
MPTAQVDLDWETRADEPKPWTGAKEPSVSWTEPHPESPNDDRIAPKVDIGQGLDAEIERAKGILKLQDDWDGEGSRAYSEETFNRAVVFLIKHIGRGWESCGLPSPIPRIGPGPDGSIDLHWRQPSWELLVNIPADPNEMATFYGDNYGLQKIRGSLDPQKIDSGIAGWLTN